MKYTDVDLNPKQYRAALIILSGGSVLDAAKDCNTTEDSIRKWRQLPEFQKLLTRAATEVFNTGLNKILLLVDKAILELEAILVNPETSDRTKLQAIQLILNHSTLAKNLNIEQRIEKIEEILLNGDREQA